MFIQYALILVSSDCESNGLEGVDRAVVRIDANQQFVLRRRHGEPRAAGDGAIARKRVSMRTGKSRNGELSLSRPDVVLRRAELRKIRGCLTHARPCIL